MRKGAEDWNEENGSQKRKKDERVHGALKKQRTRSELEIKAQTQMMRRVLRDTTGMTTLSRS